MKYIKYKKSGFTIAELLISLFIAAGFLTAGYQLYTVVIKDGGAARAEARANNVAYEYMRRYASTVTTPCVASTPLNNSAITVTSLTAVTVTVAITCPYAATTSVSEITVTVFYDTPQQKVVYATYARP